MSEPVASASRTAWYPRAIAARSKLFEFYGRAWLSHAITALASLRVADEIWDSPRHVSDVARALQLHEQSLYRILRALAANGVFEELATGYFKHNEVSEILRSDADCTWHPMAALWWHAPVVDAWKNLRNVIANGGSGFENAFGCTMYEYLQTDSTAAQIFHQAMVCNSEYAAEAITDSFPFAQYSTIADLGGGLGTLLAAILSKHPNIIGINFEVPEVCDASRDYIGKLRLADRCCIVPGNFLESVPEGIDLYMVKNSLWNWSDQDCKNILCNVRQAMGSNRDKRLLIIEYMIDSDNARWSTTFDLQMMVMPGGRARTPQEYEALLRGAELEICEVLSAEDETLLVAAPI